MSNGICASVSNPCCLMMTTLPPQPANAPLPTRLCQRASIVATAQPAPDALSKRASKITPDGTPVHSFQSLLRDLATCTLNEMTTILNNAYTFTLVTTPTPVHARAFTLLGIDPAQL